MSSCLSASDVKTQREQQVIQKSREFLRQVVLNLLLLEGPTGSIDMAFKVDRAKCLAVVLRELAGEIHPESVLKRKKKR